MPSLFRLLLAIAVLVGIYYGILLALVHFVEPKERQVTIRVPSELLYETK